MWRRLAISISLADGLGHQPPLSSFPGDNAQAAASWNEGYDEAHRRKNDIVEVKLLSSSKGNILYKYRFDCNIIFNEGDTIGRALTNTDLNETKFAANVNKLK